MKYRCVHVNTPARMQRQQRCEVKSPHTAHACVGIIGANCGRPLTALACHLRNFSSCSTSRPHLSLFAVFSHLSISPLISLQSTPALIRPPTLYCPISSSANLPSRICLTYAPLVCQPVSSTATVKVLYVLQSALSHQTGYNL